MQSSTKGACRAFILYTFNETDAEPTAKIRNDLLRGFPVILFTSTVTCFNG